MVKNLVANCFLGKLFIRIHSHSCFIISIPFPNRGDVLHQDVCALKHGVHSLIDSVGKTNDGFGVKKKVKEGNENWPGLYDDHSSISINLIRVCIDV